MQSIEHSSLSTALVGAYTYKCSYNGRIDDFIDPCSGQGLGVFFWGGGGGGGASSEW